MKQIISAIAFVFIAGIFTSNFTQITPASPSVPDAPTIRDDTIKMRSIDLERTKKDAVKNDTNAIVRSAEINTELDKKYPEIKEDFEGIQNNQNAIVEAYTTGEKIDYRRIKDSAKAIIKNAKRLDENLFQTSDEEKKKPSKKQSEKIEEKSKDVKELIVELDSAIGSFVSSPLFQNLRIVDPQVAGKAKADLEKIAEISDQLAIAADKMN